MSNAVVRPPKEMGEYYAKIGGITVETFVSAYHDGVMRPAVWIGDEMLDPYSAKALGNALIAAAERAERDDYDEATQTITSGESSV